VPLLLPLTCAGGLVGVINIAPSVLPTFNPGLRMFSYSSTPTPHLLSYTQWYVDLASANARGSIDWVVEYELLSAYGMADYSIGSWQAFQERLSTDSTLSSLYLKYQYVSSATPKSVRRPACPLPMFERSTTRAHAVCWG
jgi:hypothetical protein